MTMTYEVQVFEELIEVPNATAHKVTEDGYLYLSNDLRVVAVFKDWSFFNSFED